MSAQEGENPLFAQRTVLLLAGLYKKVRHGVNRDMKIGLPVKRVSVTLPGAEPSVIAVFVRADQEPEVEDVAGKNNVIQLK